MRRALLLTFSLLLFCAGITAGTWLSSQNFVSGIPLTQSPGAVPNTDAEPKRAFPSEEEMVAAVMGALLEEELLPRAHQIHDILGALNSEELALVFERALRLGDDQRRLGLLEAVLARWVVVDPERATALVKSYRVHAVAGMDGRLLARQVNMAWARIQPEATLVDAMAAPESEWALWAASIAIQVFEEGDLSQQLQILARQPESKLRGRICENAIHMLAKKDIATAEASLGLLSDPRQRASVQADILGTLAERDPAAALGRVALLAADLQPGSSGTRLVTKIFRAAAEQDPLAALAVVGELPNELQSQARGAALVGWAGRHPVDALEWAAANGLVISEAKALLLGNSTDISRGSANSLIGTAIDHDYANTMAWVRQQPLSLERDKMILAGFGFWGSSSAQKMELYANLTEQGQAAVPKMYLDSFHAIGGFEGEAWVRNLPPSQTRTTAVENIAYFHYRSEPDRADALVDAWPEAADRNAVLGGIALNLASDDPRRALDFARRLSPSDGREIAFEQIATAWLANDEPAARAWLLQAPELSAEQKRVLLRQLEQ